MVTLSEACNDVLDQLRVNDVVRVYDFHRRRCTIQGTDYRHGTAATTAWLMMQVNKGRLLPFYGPSGGLRLICKPMSNDDEVVG